MSQKHWRVMLLGQPIQSSPLDEAYCQSEIGPQGVIPLLLDGATDRDVMAQEPDRQGGKHLSLWFRKTG
ncbi:MAG: hypothetical protein F6K00_27870 [Leptolyngbya sp. SIOISBB]|nr:hypothetical protein [Leptolyngbya sp. SIOISBB]